MKHREYVSGGNSCDFDLRGASAFNALIYCGLREHHYILDLGCGSLAAGKLLIPYLQRGHYYGIDPNEWLISDGLKYEVGDSKCASFMYNDDFRCDQWNVRFDIIFAMSILSHTGRDLFQKCLEGVKRGLAPKGAFVFTYAEHNEPFTQAATGWVYPNVVPYSQEGIKRFFDAVGFDMYLLRVPMVFGQHWAMGKQK